MRRFRKWTAVAMGAAVVSAAGWWLATARAQAEQETHLQQQRYTVEHLVRLQLYAPNSASFTNVKVYRQSKGGCGYVESRDDDGRSTGLVAFVVTGDKDVHFEPDVLRTRNLDFQIDMMERRAQFRDLQTATCTTFDEPS